MDEGFSRLRRGNALEFKRLNYASKPSRVRDALCFSVPSPLLRTAIAHFKLG